MDNNSKMDYTIFSNSKYKSLLIIIIFLLIILFLLKEIIKKYFKIIDETFQALIDSFIKNFEKELENDFGKISKGFSKIENQLDNEMNFVDKFLSKFNLNVFSKIKEVKNIITNVFIKLAKEFITVKSTIEKIHTIMLVSLYNSFGFLIINTTFMGLLVKILIGTLNAFSVFLLLNPLTAIAGLIMLKLLEKPMRIIIENTDMIFKATTVDNPELGHLIGAKRHHRHHCFDEDTDIETDVGFKKIKEIKVNDKIRYNKTFINVTGIFKLSGLNETLYNINNVIVSGTHKIKYNGKWIYTSKHPCREKLSYKKKYLYCLTTENKQIQINNEIFMDWDEVDKNYDYYNAWLDKNTLVVMNDNTFKKINNIKIGDVLKDNSIVIGLVDLGNKKTYSYKNFIGSRNIIYYQGSKKLSTLSLTPNNQFATESKHILTNTGKILLKNNILIGDYNSSIDNLIY